MALPLIFNDIAIVTRIAAVILISSLFLIAKLPTPDKKKPLASPVRFSDITPQISLFLVAFLFISIAEPSLHGFFFAYARELGGSTRLLGVLSGTMGFVAFLCLPLMGKLVDKINPALILSISFFAQPLRILITSNIESANYLWVPILLHGITWGGVEVSAIIYLSSLVKEDQKATAVSFYVSIRMLGQLIGNALCGQIAENTGYKYMFWTTASIALLGACIYSAGSLVLNRKAQSQNLP